MRKIKISEDAYCDIEEMFSYISQGNKNSASNLRQEIYNKIKNLQKFPFVGPTVSEEDAPGSDRGYRYIVVNPYLIFYRVMDDKIIIARILHARQNWLQMLFGYSDSSLHYSFNNTVQQEY